MSHPQSLASGAAAPSRTSWLLLGIFVVSFGTNIASPLLVRYRERLALSDNETMAVFAIYVAGILGALVLAGPLSDRFGRKPVMVPAALASAMASVILIFGASSYPLLLLGRGLLGVASGGALGVGSAWLLELNGPGREQRSAIATTVISFGGFGLGPVVTAALYDIAPAPLVTPFVIHAAVTLVAAVGLLAVRETRERTAGPVRPELGVPPQAVNRFRRLVAPASAWVFAFPSAGMALFPVLLADAVGAGDVLVAGIAGGITAWAGLAARPAVSRLGPRKSLDVGMGCGVGGYIAGTIAFATGVWPLVLIAAPLLGAAAGMLTAGSLTLLGEVAEDESRGALTSTFYLFAYPGMAMPLVITGLASLSSTSTALVIVTVLGALTTVWVATAKV